MIEAMVACFVVYVLGGIAMFHHGFSQGSKKEGNETAEELLRNGIAEGFRTSFSMICCVGTLHGALILLNTWLH